MRGVVPSRATRGARLLSAMQSPKKMAPVLSSTWAGYGDGLRWRRGWASGKGCGGEGWAEGGLRGKAEGRVWGKG